MKKKLIAIAMVMAFSIPVVAQGKKAEPAKKEAPAVAAPATQAPTAALQQPLLSSACSACWVLHTLKEHTC